MLVYRGVGVSTYCAQEALVSLLFFNKQAISLRATKEEKKKKTYRHLPEQMSPLPLPHRQYPLPASIHSQHVTSAILRHSKPHTCFQHKSFYPEKLMIAPLDRKISCLLWNPKILYRVLNSPALETSREWETPTLLVPLERADPLIEVSLFQRTQESGCLPPPQPLLVSEILCSLERRTTEKVQTSTDIEKNMTRYTATRIWSLFGRTNLQAGSKVRQLLLQEWLSVQARQTRNLGDYQMRIQEVSSAQNNVSSVYFIRN